MSDERDRLASLYRDLFEIDRRGEEVLGDLTRRFGRTRVQTDGGIDAVLKTYRSAAHREMLDYIVAMINKGNGVNDDHEANEGENDAAA